jgi:hypothetical protein
MGGHVASCCFRLVASPLYRTTMVRTPVACRSLPQYAWSLPPGGHICAPVPPCTEGRRGGRMVASGTIAGGRIVASSTTAARCRVVASDTAADTTLLIVKRMAL